MVLWVMSPCLPGMCSQPVTSVFKRFILTGIALQLRKILNNLFIDLKVTVAFKVRTIKHALEMFIQLQ